MTDSALHANTRLQYFFDRSNYIVSPEGTVTVSVFLQETFNPRTGSSVLAPGTDGLIHGGVLIETTSPVPTYPARVRTMSAITGNASFDFAIIPLLPVSPMEISAGVLELSAKPVFGEVVSKSATCETVLLPLGSFTFTAGKVLGEVTFLTALNTDVRTETPSDCNVTNSGIVLDPLLQPGSAMITVSPKAGAPHFAKNLNGLADVLGALTKDASRRKT